MNTNRHESLSDLSKFQPDSCPFVSIRGHQICLVLLTVAVASFSFAQTDKAIVRFVGDRSVTPTADGGLRPVVGVHNLQVHRANRTAPVHADGLTDTYSHAPMLAYPGCWLPVFM